MVVRRGEDSRSGTKRRPNRTWKMKRQIQNQRAQGIRGGPKPTHRLAPAVRQDTKNRLWRPRERGKAIDLKAELREQHPGRRRKGKKGREGKAEGEKKEDGKKRARRGESGSELA